MEAAKLAWSRVLAFDDPLHYQASICAGDWQVYPTKRGQFRAELTQITMNQLWMQSFHHELPQIQTGTVTPNRRVIGFLTEAHQAAIHHRGEKLSPHDIIVNTETMHIRTEGDCRYGGMSLPYDGFDTACEALTGNQFAPSSCKSVVRPSSRANDAAVEPSSGSRNNRRNDARAFRSARSRSVSRTKVDSPDGQMP